MRAVAALVMAVGMMVLLGAQTAPGDDWPQWRGPRRQGVSAERGLLKEWPASGPTRVWSTTGLGAGYGSVAIAGDRIYVQGRKEGKVSVVSSLDRQTGKVVWTKVVGP